MTARRNAFMVCLLFLVVETILPRGVAARPGKAADAAADPGATIPGRFAVKVAAGVDDPAGAIRSAFASVGSVAEAARTRALLPLSILTKPSRRNLHTSSLNRIFIVEAHLAGNVARALQTISRRGDIEYAEPLYYHRVSSVPRDPWFDQQVGAMKRLDMMPAWDVGQGNRDVGIAIVDGGTFWRHEDLWPNLWTNQPEDLNHNGLLDAGPPPGGDEDGVDQDANGFVDDVIGWNCTTGSGDPDGLPASPQNRSHGTATAGAACAATDNSKGMAGTSWNCSLLPVCVAATAGDNLIEFGYDGILYAASRGARIINCSWGRTGAYSRFEQDVIDAVTSAGSLVVTAAGNYSYDNDVLPSYPASYAGVLAVGSTNTSSDILASFSNYGATIPVYAPGVVIVGPTTDGGYLKGFSGTSFSAPLVSGIAGLLATRHPEWSPEQIAGQLRMSADPIDSLNPSLQGRLGKGRVNAFRALTESHAAIALTYASAEKSDARMQKIFLPGDTVSVVLQFRNVSDILEYGWTLNVHAVSTDPVLQPLVDRVSTGFPAPGDTVGVPLLQFKVGQVTETRTFSLRVEWSWEGGEFDRSAIPMTVFPVAPTWVDQASPVAAAFYSVSARSNSIAWAAGVDADGGPAVVRTVDGGSHWNGATGNLPAEELYCVFALGEDRAFVGTGSGRIFQTSSGGSTWNECLYPAPRSSFMNGIWFTDQTLGYAMGDPPSGSSAYVVLRTSDGGQTWSHLPGEPVGEAGEAGLNNSVWWTDAEHGWFGTNRDKVWRTSDGGMTWRASPSGAAWSLGVAFADNAHGLAVHVNGSVSRTSDGGETWSNTALSPYALGAVTMIPFSPRAWVSSDARPLSSTDYGATWKEEATFPIQGSIYHLSFADSVAGWAVTSAGEILRHVPAPVTGVRGEERGLPAAYVLEQNYPNPFNPATVVSFQLPAASDVKLVVYDLLAREVAVLVEGVREAGTHSIEFDARGLPSGVYFFRLVATPAGSAGPVLLTRKALLVK